MVPNGNQNIILAPKLAVILAPKQPQGTHQVPRSAFQHLLSLTVVELFAVWKTDTAVVCTVPIHISPTTPRKGSIYRGILGHISRDNHG